MDQLINILLLYRVVIKTLKIKTWAPCICILLIICMFFENIQKVGNKNKKLMYKKILAGYKNKTICHRYLIITF